MPVNIKELLTQISLVDADDYIAKELTDAEPSHIAHAKIAAALMHTLHTIHFQEDNPTIRDTIGSLTKGEYVIGRNEDIIDFDKLHSINSFLKYAMAELIYMKNDAAIPLLTTILTAAHTHLSDDELSKIHDMMSANALAEMIQANPNEDALKKLGPLLSKELIADVSAELLSRTATSSGKSPTRRAEQLLNLQGTLHGQPTPIVEEKNGIYHVSRNSIFLDNFIETTHDWLKKQALSKTDRLISVTRSDATTRTYKSIVTLTSAFLEGKVSLARFNTVKREYEGTRFHQTRSQETQNLIDKASAPEISDNERFQILKDYFNEPDNHKRTMRTVMSKVFPQGFFSERAEVTQAHGSKDEDDAAADSKVELGNTRQSPP